MAEKSSSPASSAPAPIAEIDHGPSKLDQFLDNHQKKLIIAAVLIALGVVAYVIYDGLAEAKAQESGAALLGSKKVSEYQDVIKQWPDSKAAASALLLMADLQWADSQPDSIATLEDFIEKYPEHPALATAKTSLGLRLLEQGKTDQATAILSEVADSDTATYIAPLACIALGDIAKEAGKPQQAKTWYEKAQLDPNQEGNAFRDIAATRLILVNAKPPVKIKPAPPEPPKPSKPGTAQPETPAVTPPLLETPDTPDTGVEKQQPAPPAAPAGAEPAQSEE